MPIPAFFPFDKPLVCASLLGVFEAVEEGPEGTEGPEETRELVAEDAAEVVLVAGGLTVCNCIDTDASRARSELCHAIGMPSAQTVVDVGSVLQDTAPRSQLTPLSVGNMYGTIWFWCMLDQHTAAQVCWYPLSVC